MTEYLSGKPFSVQQRGRNTATCSHGWTNAKGVCVFCGHALSLAEQTARVRTYAEAHGGGLSTTPFPDWAPTTEDP